MAQPTVQTLTFEGLRSTMRLRWFPQANRGPAAARNVGIQKAGGEFIVFIDDDLVPEPQLLREHARSHHEADKMLWCSGQCLPPRALRWLPGSAGSKRC